MPRTRSLIAAIGLAATVLLSSACVEDTVNKALKNSGVSIDGSLPSGFPKELPTPTLHLETGVAAGSEFTLRYTSSDAAADTAAYAAALKSAGYTISSNTNNLGDGTARGNVTFEAKGRYDVIVSTFHDPAYAGGNYMAVVVMARTS